MDGLLGHVPGFARLRTARGRCLMAASDRWIPARYAFAPRELRGRALSSRSQPDRVSSGLRSGQRSGATCHSRVVGMAVPHPDRYLHAQLPLLRHAFSLAALELPLQRSPLVDPVVLVLHVCRPGNCVLPAVAEGMAGPRAAVRLAR